VKNAKQQQSAGLWKESDRRGRPPKKAKKQKKSAEKSGKAEKQAKKGLELELDAM